MGDALGLANARLAAWAAANRALTGLKSPDQVGDAMVGRIMEHSGKHQEAVPDLRGEPGARCCPANAATANGTRGPP
jgi:hypothetical protein